MTTGKYRFLSLSLTPLCEVLGHVLSPIPKLVEYMVSLSAFIWFLEYPKRNSRREHLTRFCDTLLQFPAPPLRYGHLSRLWIRPGVATWHWVILVKERAGAGLDLHSRDWLRLLLHHLLIFA